MRETLATGSGWHWTAAWCRRPNGFTLVELLVVVMIVMLLAGSLPFALDRMLPGRRVSATAQELALVIRQLQADAASSARPVRLEVHGNAYLVQRKGDRPGVKHPVGDHIELALNSISTDTLIDALVLYPDGSTSGAQLSVRQGRHRAVVDVSRLTGRVKVSE